MKTLKKFVSNMYKNQVRRSVERNHELPKYTREELYEWCHNSELFNKMYELYEMSGYKRWYAPSLDRVDNNRGYSFSNIQLVLWIENHYNGQRYCKVKEKGAIYDKRVIAKVSGKGTGVVRVDMEGNEKIYGKVQEGADDVNGDKSNIIACCRGRQKTAYGYYWEYSKK